MHLILVGGAPGAGKTTLAKKLGAHYDFPVFTIDHFKECLFDTFKLDNDGKNYNPAAYALLYMVIEELLKKDVSVIVESNFDNQFDAPKLKRLYELYQPTITQIKCSADKEILASRFIARQSSPDRHAVHTQVTSTDDYIARFYLRNYDLDIPGNKIVIDTTDFSRVTLPDLGEL